jgi:3-dehydroquinate synthase
MCRAAEIGVKLGITPPEVPEQITQAVAQFGLPTEIDCSLEDYRATVGLDKKSAGDQITLILLSKLGETAPTRMKKDTALEHIAPFAKG